MRWGEKHTGAILVFVLAAAVRLAMFAVSFPGNDKVPFWEDVDIARHLQAGEGYSYGFTIFPSPELPPWDIQIGRESMAPRPSAIKPPLYPLFVWSVFRLAGVGNFAALLFLQILLSACTAVILYASVPGRRLAKWGIGLFFALYPPFIFHSSSVPEATTLLLFIIALSLWSLRIFAESPTSRNTLLSGAAAGAATLIDPMTAPFFVAALTYCLVRLARHHPRPLRMVSLWLAAFVLILLPWTLRNATVFRTLVPIKSASGINLLVNFRSNGIHPPDSLFAAVKVAAAGRNEAEENRIVTERGLRFLFQNPRLIGRIVVHNFASYCWPLHLGDRYGRLRTLAGHGLPLAVITLLTLVAAWFRLAGLRLRSSPSLSRLPSPAQLDLAFLLVVTFTFSYSLLGAWNARFHLPVEMAMGFPVVWVIERYLPRPATSRWNDAHADASRASGRDEVGRTHVIGPPEYGIAHQREDQPRARNSRVLSRVLSTIRRKCFR